MLKKMLNQARIKVEIEPLDPLFESYTGHLDFLPQTDQGRIFSAQGELSWRRLGV